MQKAAGSRPVSNHGKPVAEIDKVLDREISTALSGIQGALVQIYDPRKK